MNIYIISGEPTDGSYMYAYVSSLSILADSEQEALEMAKNNGGLLGKSDKWTIELVTQKNGVFHESVTQDY